MDVDSSLQPVRTILGVTRSYPSIQGVILGTCIYITKSNTKITVI